MMYMIMSMDYGVGTMNSDNNIGANVLMYMSWTFIL